MNTDKPDTDLPFEEDQRYEATIFEIELIRGKLNNLPGEHAVVLKHLAALAEKLCNYREFVSATINEMGEDAAELERQRDYLMGMVPRALGSEDPDALGSEMIHMIKEGFFYTEKHTYLTEPVPI